MIILGIDTSCDETSVAVCQDNRVLSNKIWSQAILHSKFGGVYPTLAKREHQEKIDFIIKKALNQAKTDIEDIDIIAVTVGPGLAPALEVGIAKAKEISQKYKKPIFPINHLEGHILSPFVSSSNKWSIPKIKSKFPAFGLVISGGNTIFVYTEKIGKYKVLAETSDDALGEALDKGARLLGLGYPGGPVLEKMAQLKEKTTKEENPLPLPFAQEKQNRKISYSGLKTALVRLVEKIESLKGNLNKTDIINLSYFYQDRAFTHLTRTIKPIVDLYEAKTLLVGGGVAANLEIRKRLRKIAKEKNIEIMFPENKKICSDNAAMIAFTAYIKKTTESIKPKEINKIERIPNLKI